jgi:hypothetical protein
MQYIIKVFVVLLLIIAITEVGKKSQLIGAVLASLPLTSIIAICWLKFENSDHKLIINLSYNIFWMVMPSLLFFLVLPKLLERNFNFLPAFLLACSASCAAYFLLLFFLKKFAS